MRFTITTQQQPNTVEVLAIIFDPKSSKEWCESFIAQIATGDVCIEQDVLPGCSFDYRKPYAFMGLGDFEREFYLGIKHCKFSVVPLEALLALEDSGEFLLDPSTNVTIVAANKVLIH